MQHSVIAVTLGLAGLCMAQVDEAPAGPRLHNSTIFGFEDTIRAIRVPLRTPDGKTLYRDITLRFSMGTDGTLTIAEGYPAIVPSPTPMVSTFQSGKYIGPRNIANGKATIRVDGPGITTGGGSTWSLVSVDDADKCTYPGSATWYVGPLESGPQASRLKVAGITSTAWSYGVSGVGPASSCFRSFTGHEDRWENGSLIGVSQSGNTITIASFTDKSRSSKVVEGRLIYDYPAPVDQITYILVP